MSDKYYGWQPATSSGYPGASGSYVQPDYSGANDYQPTDWGYPATTIEKMWTMVQKESDERAFALAETWKRTSALLQATRDNLQRHADALAVKWKSPAGDIFMRHVGATLHSFDEWKKIADDNASGLEQLGNKIQDAQREFKPLWERYKAQQQSNEQERKDDHENTTISDAWNWATGPDSIEDVQKQFHTEAVALVKPLGELFIDVYIHKVSNGTKFKGPTDAVVSHPGKVPHPSRPAAPGSPPPGRPGGTRGAAPGRPSLPGDTDGPPTPSGVGTPPPGLPSGVALAGGTVAPPAPTGPAPTPPPVTAPGPAPAPPPVAHPGLTGRPGAPPTGSPPAKPSLPGAGNARSGAPGTPGPRGPAPAKPTLPGRGASGGPGAPGAPGSPRAGRPGAAPGAPRLPGSTGQPARPGAPRLGGSGRPASPPPSLGGKQGAAPSEPGASRPGSGRPGAAHGTPAPGSGHTGNPLSGRGNRPSAAGTPEAGATGPRSSAPGTLPKTPQANLTGRAGAAGPKAPVAGPAPALGGRRSGPDGPGRAAADPRAFDDEAGAWESDELWVAESDSVGAIEAPAEHRPQQQGKALGQD